MQVITNFSRAKTRVLEATFQLDNRHIFMVNNITKTVTEYLASHPSVDNANTSPFCYLKNMEDDGPEIALSCVIKATVSRSIMMSLFKALRWSSLLAWSFSCPILVRMTEPLLLGCFHAEKCNLLQYPTRDSRACCPHHYWYFGDRFSIHASPITIFFCSRICR